MNRKRRHSYPLSGSIVMALGTALRWTGVQRSLLSRPATHLLFLHHVERVGWFNSLVEELKQDFEFISHEEAVKRIRTGVHKSPAISFSFDDGFSSCAKAAEVLERYGTSGMLYVCSDLVGCDEAGVTAFFGNAQPEGVLNWNELVELQNRGHQIGSHTRRHFNLALASEQQLYDEIIVSRELIVKRLGRCDHFAWPYGRKQFFSQKAYDTAFEAGYRSIASGIRGSHTGAADGVILRHVIHPNQAARSVKELMAISLAGLDGHRLSRQWVYNTNQRRATT
jgi:peptidoglycan/xylan/chitin deacetylase (PgdA/CDA1 family)